MGADDNESGPLSPAERIVSDAVGRLIEFWGFKRNMGRIWGVLYLASAPVSARSLRERLVLSTGSVSMTLNELQRWGVVKRVHVDGSRQEHFAAEINLWKMVSRVFRERELLEIVEAIGALEEALAQLPENGSPVERMQRERIAHLLDVARMGRTLVDALVSTGRVDASELARQIFLGKSEKPEK
jgi:DNA-binding transcriptional regulator GbsR (MarR family)